MLTLKNSIRFRKIFLLHQQHQQCQHHHKTRLTPHFCPHQKANSNLTRIEKLVVIDFFPNINRTLWHFLPITNKNTHTLHSKVLFFPGCKRPVILSWCFHDRDAPLRSVSWCFLCHERMNGWYGSSSATTEQQVERTTYGSCDNKTKREGNLRLVVGSLLVFVVFPLEQVRRSGWTWFSWQKWESWVGIGGWGHGKRRLGLNLKFGRFTEVLLDPFSYKSKDSDEENQEQSRCKVFCTSTFRKASCLLIACN